MKYLLLPFLLFGLALHAQKRENFNIELRSALKTMEPTEELHLFLRGDLAQITTYVRENDGVVKGVVGDIASIRIPAEKMESLRTADYVDFIEFSLSKLEVLSDVMLTNNNIHPIHAGAAPLPQSFLGEDVIMAFLDTGIELDHPDFQHEDGTTRVISLWDHRQEELDPFRVPQPYGYGQEWNAEDINQNIDGHDDAGSAHGSTVTGAGAGNGSATGNFTGVAPKSDIIVIAVDFTRVNWRASIADACEFIFNKADEFGKPVVINASLGSAYGSHDGLDATALFIDDMIEEQPGRIMVAAAANSYAWDPWHLATQVPQSDTAFTWFSYLPAGGSVLGEDGVFFELWADSADFYETSYTIGADLAEPNYSFSGYAGWRTVEANLNTSVIDTIFQNGNILGIVETWCGQRGEQYLVQVNVREAFSDQYKWRFASTGGGTYDVWSTSLGGTSVIETWGLPESGEYPAMSNYRFPDRFKTIWDSWICSDKVITVANYVNRNEYTNVLGETTFMPDFVPLDISVNSSQGPTRDNRLKPDIAATGDIILAAGRLASLESLIANEPERVAEGGMHSRNGGTSMAAPVVAGVAALYLERDPSATHEDVKSALIDYALADQFTGELPNLRWGYGKLNGFATLTEPFGVTSSEFVAANGTIKIYPNPSSGDLNIVNHEGDLRTLDLYDLSGRLVKSINLSDNSGETITVSLQDVANGVYVVRALQENGQLLQSKLMIEK